MFWPGCERSWHSLALLPSSRSPLPQGREFIESFPPSSKLLMPTRSECQLVRSTEPFETCKRPIQRQERVFATPSKGQSSRRRSLSSLQPACPRPICAMWSGPSESTLNLGQHPSSCGCGWAKPCPGAIPVIGSSKMRNSTKAAARVVERSSRLQSAVPYLGGFG